jgi:DNA-binding NtrC family response regulator
LAPLRERREDIPYLTATFIRACGARLKKPLTGITPSAERYLQQAAWPGNIRELRNVIERACIHTDSSLITERDLQMSMSTSTAPVTATAASLKPAEANRPATDANADLLSTAQAEQIRRVLREAGGNKAAAARLLGVSRRSLYRWLERLAPDA